MVRGSPRMCIRQRPPRARNRGQGARVTQRAHVVHQAGARADRLAHDSGLLVSTEIGT